jgi:hypothetical protein
MAEITKEDVLGVAKALGYKPTNEQVNDVIAMYESEQEADPTATWDLVVEHCLSTLEVEQTTLIDQVIEEIKKDVASGDLTAVEELLKFVPSENLKAYLP